MKKSDFETVEMYQYEWDAIVDEQRAKDAELVSLRSALTECLEALEPIEKLNGVLQTPGHDPIMAEWIKQNGHFTMRASHVRRATEVRQKYANLRQIEKT